MLIRRCATVVYGVLLIGILCVQPCLARNDAGTFSGKELPKAIPHILVRTMSGDEVLLSAALKPDKPDQKVLLHLWAPTCAPCRKELTVLNRELPRLRSEGLKIVLVAQEAEARILVPAFYRRYAVAFDSSYLDERQALSQALAPKGLPSTYLLAPNGSIHSYHAGSLSWDTLTSGNLETTGFSNTP